METNFTQISPKFICECCNIKTNNKKDYAKHILTSKHKKLTSVNKMETDFTQNIKKTQFFTCKICNKEYFSRVGLWKHNKICVTI